MDPEIKKPRGGKREGAGRPVGRNKVSITISISKDLLNRISTKNKSRSEQIEDAIIKYLQ